MSSTDFHSKALQFALNHLKTWKAVTKDTSSITLLTGNSNKVFLLETSLPIIPKQIIYRVFGPNEITDKFRERKIFSQLSLYNFGPKNLADSETERLEEYLEGFHPIPNKMFHDRRILKKIAKKLKRLHNLNMSKVIGGEGIMTDSNLIKWKNLIVEKRKLYEEAGVWEKVQDIIGEDSLDAFNEVMPRESEVVYCHLDPSPLNFLYNEQKNKVAFVDFEFSGYSYRSMDIGLMLNEVQMNYLVEESPFFSIFEDLAPTDALVKEIVLAYGEGKELWIEVKRSLIASHFVWSLWGLANYNGPTNGYDYLQFGLTRFNMFEVALKEYVDKGKIEYLKAIAEDLFDYTESDSYLCI